MLRLLRYQKGNGLLRQHRSKFPSLVQSYIQLRARSKHLDTFLRSQPLGPCIQMMFRKLSCSRLVRVCRKLLSNPHLQQYFQGGSLKFRVRPQVLRFPDRVGMCNQRHQEHRCRQRLLSSCCNQPLLLALQFLQVPQFLLLRCRYRHMLRHQVPLLVRKRELKIYFFSCVLPLFRFRQLAENRVTLSHVGPVWLYK